MSAHSTRSPFPLEPNFQLLFEATPIPYLVLTPDFTIVAANEARLRATMTVREQIVGKGLFDAFPDNPEDPAATGVRNLRASLLRVLANKASDAMPIQKYDIPARDSTGEFVVRYWSPLNTPVLDSSGEVVYIIHQVEDVTDRILKQQAIEESEAHFREIANAIPQMVWSSSPDGDHYYYNKQYYDFTGVPADSTTGEAWDNVLHPDDQQRAGQDWKRSLATGDAYQIEYRVRHRSGDYRWVLAQALPVRSEAGEILRWMGSATDIHEQKLAEQARSADQAALRCSREELRRLSAHVQLVREEEKARIARDLHDDLGQRLTTLKMAASQLENSAFPNRPWPPHQALNAIYTMIDDLVKSIRQTAADLHPVMLEDLGLIAAIDNLIDDFSARYRIRVIRRIDQAAIHFNRGCRNDIFRIVQEALTNVARHSGATEVVVEIARDDPNCNVRIVDNGRGASHERPKQSFGMLSMRERATLLGGELRISTEPGAGFSLTAVLPLSSVEARDAT